MTIKDIAEMLMQDKGPILLTIMIMLTLVELVPIKLNPWSAIFNWFGKKLNKEVIEKIDVIEERLDEHIKDSEETDLKARRTAILDFGSNVIRGVNYHKEKFDFMIGECDDYEDYCKKHDIKNGVAEASIAEIRRIYQERLRNNNFLVENEETTRKVAARKKGDDGQ